MSRVAGSRLPWPESHKRLPNSARTPGCSQMAGGRLPGRLSGHPDACRAPAPAEADISEAAPPGSPARGKSVSESGSWPPRPRRRLRKGGQQNGGARRRGSPKRSGRQPAASRPETTAAHGQRQPRLRHRAAAGDPRELRGPRRSPCHPLTCRPPPSAQRYSQAGPATRTTRLNNRCQTRVPARVPSDTALGQEAD